MTDNNFADGTYYLRVRGWNAGAGGHLTDQGILKVCHSHDDNYIVLTVDNRVVTAGPNDLHGNPCTVVHLCTNEPDTAIVSVKIIRPGNPPVSVQPCGSERVTASDQVEIEFIVNDPDGHLESFDLYAHYDVNLARNLLALGTLAPSAAPVLGVAPADKVGPTYALAVAAGATRPIWRGGAMKLTLPATGSHGAFPETCCYQLRLNAYKRTIVNCDHSYNGHANTSETSFTITV